MLKLPDILHVASSYVSRLGPLNIFSKIYVESYLHFKVWKFLFCYTSLRKNTIDLASSEIYNFCEKRSIAVLCCVVTTPVKYGDYNFSKIGGLQS